MHLFEATIQVGGDKLNTVRKHGTDTITPSEIMILRDLHGDENVCDLKVVADVSRSQSEELIRLRGVYGADKVNKVYQGSMPTLPQEWKDIAGYIGSEIEFAPDMVRRRSKPVVPEAEAA